MKIDLSTILFIALVVSPGLFALRSRSRLVPSLLRSKGATEEIAELVSLSLLTHSFLILLAALLAALFGVGLHQDALFFFREMDGWEIVSWSRLHGSAATLLVTAYLLLSFVLSHILGILYAAWELKGDLTERLLKLPGLQRFGFTGVLGEQPILYDLLSVSPGADAVFIEARMKADAGFYSGQIDQFAIVRDEESHRPIYLIDVFYKKDRDSEYEGVAGGLLLDLADVTSLRIEQIKVTDLEAPTADEQHT